MPTDQNAACENINRMFFTTVSTKQRKEQLVFDLDAARRRVILLQNELDTLEKMGDVRNLTSSMLEELERLFPWLHVTTCTETNLLSIPSGNLFCSTGTGTCQAHPAMIS